MKPVIISSIALVVSLIIAACATTWLAKKRHKEKNSRGKWILIFCMLTVLFFVLGAFAYFGTYYRATKIALKNMENTRYVTITRDADGYFFDGPGTEKAFIFYPGAKVDERAYAPILLTMAEEGVDCFMVKMPLHLAITGREKATNIMRHYAYEEWFIGGHSLGGAMAALYAHDHSDMLDGVVLFAAFPTKPLDDSLRLVSVVGTKDKVLNWKSYRESRKNWPKNASEVRIYGGNHEQFGAYGHQKGDGKPKIKAKEQFAMAADAALRLIYNMPIGENN
ncbi:Alpha/beta hydrolase family protein [Lachnospiraceae bacterium XBB1006]|nr:Alpha/beta hydrolase family protein [Lachnospiraceae bacterium XBB1006]